MTTEQTNPPCECIPTNNNFETRIERFYVTLPGNEWAAGLSLGVIKGVAPSGEPMVTKCYSGYADATKKIKIDEDTVFEIGSTTKTFTTTMLAAAVNQGKVNLDIPAQSYYDQYGPSVTLPVYKNPNTGVPYPMTMLDLADYTSGILDKSPTNQRGPNEYTYELMHAYLEALGNLLVQPGTQYNYVNTNFGIIAELMMSMGGFISYNEALQNLISDAQLNMGKTGVIESNSPQIANLAVGYSAVGDAQTNYALGTWPALQGAGAIYSTLDDMLEWLKFNMGLTASPYNDLLPSLQEVRFPAGAALGNGLGWFIKNLPGTQLRLINKNGGTNGFHSWIGFLPDSKIGAVLLCNTALRGDQITGISPVDRLGHQILKSLVTA